MGTRDHASPIRILAADPTRTLTLRNKFTNDLASRYNTLKADIRTTVVDNDAFGLNDPRDQLIGILEPAPKGAFNFRTDQRKVAGFMEWLEEQVDAGILEVRQGAPRTYATSSQWMDVYIGDGYQKGMERGINELKKLAKKTGRPSIVEGTFIESLPGQSTNRFVDAAFGTPFHADKVGSLYIRTFEELKGINAVMSQQISRELASGLAQGKGTREIARLLNDRVEKIGKTRSKILARTEVIRAHHTGNIAMYRQAGVEGVTVKAEWSTAGDDRVCPDCAALEGKIFTLDEIEPLIPLHPQCRCVAIPATDDVQRTETGERAITATV